MVLLGGIIVALLISLFFCSWNILPLGEKALGSGAFLFPMILGVGVCLQIHRQLVAVILSLRLLSEKIRLATVFAQAHGSTGPKRALWGWPAAWIPRRTHHMYHNNCHLRGREALRSVPHPPGPAFGQLATGDRSCENEPSSDTDS